MKRIALAVAAGLLFFLSLPANRASAMYIELSNGHVMEGKEIDPDHESYTGGLVYNKDGYWTFRRSYETAEADITFRITFSIKVGVAQTETSYPVYGSIFACAMKSDTEIANGTVTDLDTVLTFGEPVEIDTGMSHDEEKVTLKLLIEKDM